MKLVHAAFVPVMFAHWVGWAISLGYISCLATVLLLTRLFWGRLVLNKTIVGILLFSALFLSINMFHMAVGQNAESAYSNLYQYLSLFIVVAIILFSQPWEMSEILKVARVIFWVAFYSIALEFLAVNFLGVSKESMPAVRYSPSYFGDFMGWHRPFGLTGQSSANGGILLLSFLLLAELRVADIKVVLALLVGAALTISGQAILATIFILGLLQLDRVGNLLAKAVLALILLLSLFLLLDLDLFQKISLDYLIYVLWEKAYLSETIGVLNGWQLLFGTLGSVAPEGGYGTEVFMIESVRLFGIVFTVAFWVFIWLLVRRARIRFIWFVGCILASIHYPTVFYIEAQLPLAILYLSTLNKSRKINVALPVTLNNGMQSDSSHQAT